MTCSFKELIAVKETIEHNDEDTQGSSIVDFAESVFSGIDSMLADLQSKLICGNITTRKVARLILVNMQSVMHSSLGESVYNSTESGKYLSDLIAHYDGRGETDESEPYIGDSGDYYRPFQTLKTKTI